jgi:hypothetical protein
MKLRKVGRALQGSDDATTTSQGDLKGKDDLVGSTFNDLFIPCPRGEQSRIGYAPIEKANRFLGMMCKVASHTKTMKMLTSGVILIST